MAKLMAALLLPAVAIAQPVTNSALRTTNSPAPARIIELKVPANIAANAEATRIGIPGLTTLKGIIALPAGFDLRRAWPVLIITAPSGASAVQSFSAYTNVALPRGWVVAAVDGPKVNVQNDTSVFAWAMISSLLDQLRTSWPQSKQWPFACAGFSGGAKRAAMTAAQMVRQGDSVIGVFMGGCNEDRATTGYEISRPGTRFLDVPMFLSNGARDPIAGPNYGERLRNSMEQTGFRRIRAETYDGQHRLDTNQVRAALEWFRAK
jgi:predicted esterase